MPEKFKACLTNVHTLNCFQFLGGYVITGPRGASRPPARTHAVGPGTGKSRGGPSTLATPPRSRSRAPSKPPGVRPASARGPWPRHSLENPTAKALLARPRAQPSARRPPTARGGSVITGPRGASRPPARTHTVGLGTGKSGGGPYVLATPPGILLKCPHQLHRVCLASVRGPWSAIAVARCPLARGHTAPHDPRRPPRRPIVCSGSMRACENGGPPPLPFREGRRRIGRGGETPPPFPFSRALCGVPRPAPG